MTTMKTGLYACASLIALLGAPIAAAQTAPQTTPQAPGEAGTTTAPAPAGQTIETPAPADDGGDIVVTGIRASLGSAQAIKRNADQIIDAIVAEDIGKLPDNNAAEALARVTGVQVTRFRDEADSVSIRGLPNVATTLDGREIFTADGRAVALQDFPAAALSAVEVFKSTTADNLEGGIAGLVNIRLRRPFDFDGATIAGGVRGTWNDQSRKYDPIANLLVSQRWDTGIGEVGVLLNGSYVRSNYHNSVRFNGFYRNPSATQVIEPTSVGRDFTYPQDIGLSIRNGQRTRPSINGSLQWRPSKELELYVDGLWQGFRDSRSDDFISIPILGGNAPLSNVVLRPGTTTAQSLTAQITSVTGPTKRTNRSETDTFQFAAGAKYDADNVKFLTDLAYTKSTVTSNDYNVETAFRQNPSLDVTFNADPGVDFRITNIDLLDYDSYNFRALLDARLRSRGSQWQWRGEGTVETGSNLFREFQFGLRYANRVAQAQSGTRYGAFPQLGIALADVPGLETGAVIHSGFRGSDIQQQRTWITASRGDIRDNIDALRAFTLDGLIRSNAGAGTIAAFQSDLPLYDPVNNFRAREKVYTSYAQLKYEFDLGFPIDGVIGTRVVITDNTLNGTSRVSVPGPGGAPVTSLQPINSSEQYVDLLPNISARARFTDQLQLRLSRTETLTRPGFNQLTPALVINQGTEGGLVSVTATGGNPALRPIRSDNYDASLEWYFSRTGSITVAGFYRKINGFISSYRLPENDPVFGRIDVFRPQNAGSGKIKGVEAAATTFFDFLPGALAGFGAQVNATYIDGKQSLPSIPGVNDRTGALPGVSDWTYNLIGLYERGPVSARLAYNRRSAYVTNYTAGGLFAAEYNKAISRLDFSASITPVEAVTITFDATNLLGKPFESYFAEPIYPRDTRYEARIYSIGARFRF